MTFQIRIVMAALDGSVRAPAVYHVASGIAARFGARLYVFRALDIPPEFPAAAAYKDGDPLPAFLEQQAREQLAFITNASRDAVKPEPPIIIASHQPWRAIVDSAERLSADLIVMGSHGYGGLDRVLGTTAGKVANHATCNVFIVHERSDDATSTT
jgi:nucleotide-binding universal stress UspA family protein